MQQQVSNKSVILVALQFLAISGLALTGNVLPGNILLLLLDGIAIGFGLWAASLMNFQFNIVAEPKPTEPLLRTGPYKFIRHPMYAAVLLATFSWTLSALSIFNLTLWVLLLVIIVIKINYEEKLLATSHPEYPVYQAQTKKLVPFIY